MFHYIRLRGNVCVMDNNYFNNEYVSINDVAQAKGLKSNRPIRLESISLRANIFLVRLKLTAEHALQKRHHPRTSG